MFLISSTILFWQALVKSDKIDQNTIDCTDYTLNYMFKKQSLNSFFDPNQYYKLWSTNNIIWNMCGMRLLLEDQKFQIIREHYKDIMTSFAIWNYLPILTWSLHRKRYELSVKYFRELMVMIMFWYNDQCDEYDSDEKINMITTMKKEKKSLLEKNNCDPGELIEDNMNLLLYDFLTGGLNTTATSLSWFVLYMLSDRKFENKMRNEIKEKIGIQPPTSQDQNNCVYIMASIHEILRLRPAVPVGVPHQTRETIEIGEFSIPAGTQIIFDLASIMRNPEFWKNPEEFDPDRFIENGKFKIPLLPYVPFSVGLRKCIGDKFAISTLFLMITRFLQKTMNSEITIEILGKNHPHLPNKNIFPEQAPEPYLISFKDIS